MKKFDEERLKEEYAPKKSTGLDEAKRLDRKAKLPANVFAYTFGIVGALVLGVGMCLAMEIIATGTAMMVLGIVVGLVGIAMVAANYPIYKVILSRRKEKYATSILLALNKDER